MDDFYGPAESQALQDRMTREGRQEIELSPEERVNVENRIKAFENLFDKKLKAKYKIEIQFLANRSTWKPFHGIMSWYLSGSKLGGGGDEKLYICPAREVCQGIILPVERIVEETPDQQSIPRVLCQSCGTLWKESELIGELLFNLTAPKWAEAVHKMFVRFSHNADIYLKYHREDIRVRAMAEARANRGGEEITKARLSRDAPHVYPLKNIIKDTSAGAQLYARFLAFINS